MTIPLNISVLAKRTAPLMAALLCSLDARGEGETELAAAAALGKGDAELNTQNKKSKKAIIP